MGFGEAKSLDLRVKDSWWNDPFGKETITVVQTSWPLLSLTGVPACPQPRTFLFVGDAVLSSSISHTALLFSHSVISNSFWSHRLQHARLQCTSLSPRVCSNSCPLNQWCHPTISSSIIPFSSCPQSFPASGSFQKSQFFTLGGQSIGVSASAETLCCFLM